MLFHCQNNKINNYCMTHEESFALLYVMRRYYSSVLRWALAGLRCLSDIVMYKAEDPC